MKQPLVYVDPKYPDYVCCLRNPLYGLKQAPRAWYQHFASYISTIGFMSSRLDNSLSLFTAGPTLYTFYCMLMTSF